MAIDDAAIERATENAPLLAARFLEPPSFAWGRYTAADGTALRWGHLAASEPRIDCILVGGFTEFIEKYFETIRDLAARGVSVWCLDWRGQGGSDRPATLPSRPRARDFDGDAADLAGFAAAMLPGDRPRLLVAHSMGGAIALLCLSRHPKLFDAAILSAPMFGLASGGIPPGAARLLARLATAFGLTAQLIPGAKRWSPGASRSPEQSRTSSDPERSRLEHAWFAARPELSVDGPTYGWVTAAFRLVARLRDERFLAGIRTPILIGSPGIETIVDARAHRHVASHLPDCTVVELPQSKHEPFLERDAVREAWFAAIDQFLAARLLATN